MFNPRNYTDTGLSKVKLKCLDNITGDGFKKAIFLKDKYILIKVNKAFVISAIQ